jgi:perosamine synthetase
MRAIPTISQTLAIDGGKPVRETLLPYARQLIDEEDIGAVVEVLRSDWLTTGPKVDEFEREFAAWLGAKHAVSFSSGTAALHGAAFAAGLKAGDEAITSPLTFVATANCLLYQEAKPVFTDVCPDTLNIDPERLAASISSKTRAILPVAYAGHPAEMDAVMALAEKHGLIVIEDACHALGAEYRGRRTGAIAHMTVFSFHPVKHLATGEGGMVTTDHADFAESLRRFRNHGISVDARERKASGAWFYDVEFLGFNYRLTDIACALGVSQLKKLEANLARRREIAERYNSAFRELPGITFLRERESVKSAWHLYPVRIDKNVCGVSRGQFFRALRAENIGVNVHYIPVHLHSLYRERFGYRGGEFSVAEAAYEQLISLPMFHGMTERDVDDVIAAVRKVVAHYVR